MTEKFPTINSTLSPNDLGKLIQQKYGLSDKTECSIFRLAMNHLYIVYDVENKYVFRVYTHNWRTKSDIEEELRLLLHLKEADRQVAFPIADKSNQYIQEIEAPEGTRFGVLFSYAKGAKTARFSPQTSFLIGQALAKVHQSTENFELARISYNTQNLLDNSILGIKKFFNKSNSEVIFLEKLSAFLTLKIQNIDKPKMRYGSVHLDVWFDNLHIDDEKEITFFDFDFCGNGYLCVDISYFLFQLLATNLNEEEYQEKAESFLNGYETVTEISAEEKKFLPYACLAIMVYYISVQCDRFEYWTNIFVNEDHLKRMVGNLKRWISYNKIEIE
ncbi:aminoglycoside phosphotransferase [Elizabethkingia meningoseptica]|uniref:phosphotransferase n=1 Tax=Elizabethkingia meningoseptica TaxID=238 RepID=UPI000332CE90|nr:phosphotransferase [Elizabethkingia meningoseptica]AQX03885.1 aminoglycoside phosphotransferase [Elizabethkingia meningoseptica]AQX45924.1 aminoglycoside phosphotransferase [Elizabethkingia meningoseptica]EOR28991.1 aminoglycoside phosphotransferase [Elizabethkingia meningoseptica ATCC 13253 = NBRC 12535]KUY15217.1 aminoglycoside phosphotransferase [Elizabethkingia meningoseptica]OPB69412.1 aminoglycoside phosphotransferase [Elizabethkingia meningoseptica]